MPAVPRRLRSRILGALRGLVAAELSPDFLLQFFTEIGDLHNERGAALLLARHLEDALQFAIVNRLKIPPDRFVDMFEYDRPAGNFDNKIRLAHSIRLITDRTRNTIEVIKQIRNAFAHALNPISFDTEQVATACLLIEEQIPFPPISMGMTSEPEQTGLSDSRRKYHRACDVIAHNLIVVAGGYMVMTQTRPPDSA
jgi:hypothetical protein